MLNCIIIDDEPLALDLLEDYIRKIPFLRLVNRCSNALDALNELQNNTIDLVFSDIQMHGLSGIQLIKTLPAKPMFIIVTAYSTYAVESYELDIVDYLMKPVPYERFIKACNKALARYNTPKKTESPPEFVFVHVDYSLIKIMLDEVLYIEGLRDYIKIHFINQKRSMLVRQSLKGVEETFPPARFIRIHKSYVINISCITAIRKNSLFINEFELPISEQYKEVVQQLINGKI